MSNPHSSAVRIFAAMALIWVGCGTGTQVESPTSETRISSPPATNRPDAHPRSTSTFEPPAGSEQTRQFLAWARERHFHCYMQLDANGDCVQLDIDICYDPRDEDLKQASGLKRIRSLSFNALSITDDGLRYLEQMTVLKSLRMAGTAKISDGGLERLKQSKPELAIE